MNLGCAFLYNHAMAREKEESGDQTVEVFLEVLNREIREVKTGQRRGDVTVTNFMEGTGVEIHFPALYDYFDKAGLWPGTNVHLEFEETQSVTLTPPHYYAEIMHIIHQAIICIETDLIRKNLPLRQVSDISEINPNLAYFLTDEELYQYREFLSAISLCWGSFDSFELASYFFFFHELGHMKVLQDWWELMVANGHRLIDQKTIKPTDTIGRVKDLVYLPKPHWKEEIAEEFAIIHAYKIFKGIAPKPFSLKRLEEPGKILKPFW